jgi:hypothetical protein
MTGYSDFLITQNDAPQPVGLVWASDQLVADKRPDPRWDSNPQSQ